MMAVYLKKAVKTVEAEDTSVQKSVADMIARIRKEGEEAVFDYALKLDGWQGDFVLSDEKRQALIAQVSAQEKSDIDFAHEQIVRFARAQKESLKEFSLQTIEGVTLGQKIVPVQCAGCYVPGGRYAHTASALMSIATAKVAGVPFIVAASPPKGESIAPSIAYAMDLAGADVILEMGGVHAISSMAFGLFSGRRADILVGPGNAYVAEAKRLLFGEVGIDVFAGPTESAIIADENADAMTVAVDLASQAEHGPNSPVWLFTQSKELGEKVLEILPKIASDMPSGDVVKKAWADFGEVIFSKDREELAQISDDYASEHLQLMTGDNNWWKERLVNYGSLFIGEGATVTHGDKCSGTNHILPTKKAARYTGGLNVMKFLKILTWQEIEKETAHKLNAVASRISRIEGMDGHARACDWRLRKFNADTTWDFEVANQKRYE